MTLSAQLFTNIMVFCLSFIFLLVKLKVKNYCMLNIVPLHTANDSLAQLIRFCSSKPSS